MENLSLLPFTTKILSCWRKIHDETIQAYQRLLEATQNPTKTEANFQFEGADFVEAPTMLSEKESKLQEQLCWSRNQHYLCFIRYETEKAESVALRTELEATRACS